MMTVADLIKELQGYNSEKEISAVIVDQGESSTTWYPYGVDVSYNRDLDKVGIVTIMDSSEEGD